MLNFPSISLDGVLAVMIDIDNTLYSYDITHEKALAHCAETFLAQHDMIDAETFKIDYNDHRNRVINSHKPSAVCRSRLLAFLGMFEAYRIKSAWQLAEEFDTMYWQYFYNYMKVDNKAFIFLQNCQQKNIPVCAVTDMQMAVQVRKLQALGCQSYIDYLATSEEAGHEKPTPIMFELGLSKLQQSRDNLRYQDCIMVGDNQTKDIDGAKGLGIATHKVIIRKR